MTTAPDCIFPIVGSRAWRWNALGLHSLNWCPWHPGEPFTAECERQGCHEGPRTECTCGVYASKSLDHLCRNGYMEARVHGEVSLWGRVVEHEYGWRAQFAYPKNFVVPLAILPSEVSCVESWLKCLLAYRCDIFLLAKNGTVPLWLPESGFDPNGINLIVQQCSAIDERRRQQRQLRRGNRVAVLGHGIAVVEQAGHDKIRAMLGGTDVLTFDRDAVAWDERNQRWETVTGAAISMTAERNVSSFAAERSSEKNLSPITR
jgi:hypothetical protein